LRYNYLKYKELSAIMVIEIYSRNWSDDNRKHVDRSPFVSVV